MSRLFVDSSALFFGAYSSRGHSRDLLMMTLRGDVDLVVSRIVLEETRRNLAQNAPESLPFWDLVMESIFPVVEDQMPVLIPEMLLKALERWGHPTGGSQTPPSGPKSSSHR
jgi:hypothetical protein